MKNNFAAFLQQYVCIYSCRLGACIAFLALVGCSTSPTRYDKSSNPPLKRIALLPIEEPSGFRVWNNSGLAVILLPVTLAQASMAKDTASLFWERKKERDYKFGALMASKVEQEFSPYGIVVRSEKQMPLQLGTDNEFDYSKINVPDVDALLHIRFGNTGYYSGPYSLSYAPVGVVFAKLIDAKTKKVLYSEIIWGGIIINKWASFRNVPHEEKYEYGSNSALQEHLDEALDGIASCHAGVAKIIAAELK